MNLPHNVKNNHIRMKKKILISSSVLVFSLFSLQAVEEDVVVLKNKNGTENIKELSDLQRITFNGSTLNLVSKNESSTPFAISQIQKILFEKRANSSIEEVLSAKSIFIYPNPVQDILFVEGLEINTTVRIFDMNGTLVRNEMVDQARLQLNVSDLPKGIYLLQTENQTVRFIKK